MNATHVDVLIIGAGLSGIGAAYHLQHESPSKSFLLLEMRNAIGGTWDLFRYPGIRSDSDMYTLGYSFKPWTNPKAIADGPSILEYIRETAEANGIDKKIRFGHRVERASWSSADARWTVEAREIASGRMVTFTCNFLFSCSGYYDYDAGYTPKFEGVEHFKGRIVHPQKWTSDIEYAGKRVVVIGSGATAVTLVPAMAKDAAHVTMLQRSPTYIVTAPERDKVADWLRERLPSEHAYAITRWKNVFVSMALYNYCRRYPDRAKRLLTGLVRKQVGEGIDVGTHFTPYYKPWDQRLCLVPDGDLFKCIRSGKAEVVTDHIESFTEKGIKLKSGRELEADLVVTATGLRLKFLGGVKLEVDGKEIEPPAMLTYKGMMFSDIPNLAVAIGYTNASWTLKCDLTCEYVCRLLNHMDANGFAYCVPRRTDSTVKEEPLLDFSSGYVQRSIGDFPRQGSIAPWKLYQNYALDRLALRNARVDDGKMQFVKRSAARGADAQQTSRPAEVAADNER